jgi:signal transduction histidine kinase
VLSLVEDKQMITLQILDDGVGFLAEPLENKGIGLKIMQHRAGLINAHLTVLPADHAGTTVTCKLFKDTIHEQTHD